MSSITSPARIDPLHVFVEGASNAGSNRPIPLIATRFDVRIAHGLAIVSTTRTFRNEEPESIEATITFPIPVHAVLFALEARINGRVLQARARRRKEARDTYEGALERGRMTVLHEEVLRGVHMLSVGHIAPAAEIEVSAHWTMTLTNIAGRGHLRIPLTVGHVYGRSGLPDSDDLVHGGPKQTGRLTVSCQDGQVTLRGGSLQNGEARIGLDAPIDLEVSGWVSREMTGRAADGRRVALRIEPCPVADAALDVAVIVDRSGSMGERCTGDRQETKHSAVVRGLQSMGDEVGARDSVDVWQFSDSFDRVGSTRDGQSLRAVARRLSGPDGGTNIGEALAGVVARSDARDLLLITDGKSYALDVQALARTGRRFSVVLVGEDSLEANVGHLAALTAGEILVASGSDLAGAIAQSLRSLRFGGRAVRPIDGAPQDVLARRSGIDITASWHDADPATVETLEARAVAALAASIALPALDEENAARQAEAEGLVTHLTSLLLIDEAAAIQEGIPATRKVPLPTPRTAVRFDAKTDRCMGSVASHKFAQGPAMDYIAPPEMLAAPARPRIASRPRRFAPSSTPVADAPEQSSVGRNLSDLAARIDWNSEPSRLQAGDLSRLDRAIAAAIRDAAAQPEVIALARHLGIDPVKLVIALLARAAAARSRTAARIAKAVLRNAGDEQLTTVCQALQLD